MSTQMKLRLAWVSALLLAAPVVIAAPHDGDGAGHRGDRDGGMRGGLYLSQLNLTDTQRTRIEQIEAVKDPQIASLRTQVRAQEQALEAMSPDQAGYQATAASLAQAEAAMTQARVMQRAHLYAQVYAFLTPSQRAQLAQLKASAAASDREQQP